MPTNAFSLLAALVLILNVTGFILVGLDKKRSREDSRRIPEVYIFFIAVFFAALGVFLGMLFFKHKTLKIYFTLGIGLLFVEQLALVALAARIIN